MNKGGGTGEKAVAFDDVKYYPAKALMTCTYYDPKWRKPILTVDANENPSQLVTYDDFGRPVQWHKVDKSKDAGEVAYKKAVVMRKEYHLAGDAQ